MTLVKKISLTNARGWERELDLPAKYEICDRCRGTGKHVNPAIDEHGISPEEFAEDPDFEEAYFEGRYDIRCEEGCDNGKAIVFDEERIPKKLMERIWKKLDEDAAYEAERREEIRMGY